MSDTTHPGPDDTRPADDRSTMTRTSLAVDGVEFLLAQGQDLAKLMREIERAAASTPRFVGFTVVGNKSVSALITPRTRVVLAIDTVPYDARDTGDQAEPFGGMFDL